MQLFPDGLASYFLRFYALNSDRFLSIIGDKLRNWNQRTSGKGRSAEPE